MRTLELLILIILVAVIFFGWVIIQGLRDAYEDTIERMRIDYEREIAQLKKENDFYKKTYVK